MKIRLDQYILENGYADSRRKAQAIIMSGIVYVNNQKEDKPGTQIKDTDEVEVRGKSLIYVSRGGLKLEKAVKTFSINLKDKICADIGASTGGFTDCMLQNGAKKVYAVDVGQGQLAWKLRTDNRVVNMEKTNFRYVTSNEISEKIQFFGVDVSFISLSHIFPALKRITDHNACGVCLVKPQFEAGREKVGKKGVVRDPSVHREVILESLKYANENGFFVQGLTYSPIKGPKGNIEFLTYVTKAKEKNLISENDIFATVKSASEELGLR